MAALSGILFSQNVQIDNIRSVGVIPNTAFSDIWGYTAPNGHEFALAGKTDGTSIIDISTNPHDPTEVGFIPGVNSTWRDLKVHGHYCYVTNETGGGVDIISLEDPFNPYKVVSYTASSPTAHNIFIADGYAYLVGSGGGAGQTNAWQGIIILDLADPENPNEVSRWEEAYIHDLYVKNDTAYAGGIYQGSLFIIDVSDKSNPTTMVEHNYSNYGSHAVWVSGDSKYAITADEKSGGFINIFDIQDFSNINHLSTWYPNETGAESKSVHNVFWKDDLLYISYYVYGTRIVDMSDPSNPIEVGYYDFYPGQSGLYSGNWGTYPYTANGLIYSTDFSGNGLFVMSYPYMGEVEFEDLNDTEDTASPISLDVEIEESADYSIDYYTLQLFWGLNGVITDSAMMSASGGNNYSGSITPSGEVGIMQYYVAFETTSGSRVTKPYGAPFSTFSFNIGSDQIPPVVHSLSDLEDQFYPNGAYDVHIVTSDNIGIGHVELQWQIGNGDIQSTTCSESALSGVYEGILTYSDVEPGTIITYWTTITDASSMANETVSDSKVFSITENYTLGDFENVNALDRWNLGEWGRQYVNSNINYTLNNSPGTNYEPNSESPCYLVEPLDLTYFNQAYLHFFSGEMFGDGDFGYLQFKRGSSGIWQTALTVNSFNQMQEKYVDLDNFINEEELYIRLLFTSDSQDEAIGWFVDDIHLVLNQVMPEVVIDDEIIMPNILTLNPAYPNPFNPTTVISYNLPQAGFVNLKVYDLMGREIRNLSSGFENAGMNSAMWDAKDNQGNIVSSGVYIYRLEAAGQAQSNKLILLK
jgi:choice-of-anchor B domain-containing protein